MTFKEELEQITVKELNEAEQKVVDKIKNQITTHVKEHGMYGIYKNSVQIEKEDVKDIRSDAIIAYMKKEGLDNFRGGMTSNTINVLLNVLFDPTYSTETIITFNYVVRF